MGFFDKIKQGLTKTKTKMDAQLTGIFAAYEPGDEEFFEDLEETLILADTGVETTTKAIAQLRKAIELKKLRTGAEVKKEFMQILTRILKVQDTMLLLTTQPSVVLVVGVNGVGKTTTIGKLAAQLKKEGNRVLLSAADTFRAAAADQLTVWAQRAGVDIVKHEEGSDPAAVVFDSIQAAKARGTDVVIIDTAGRLHNKANLMNEHRSTFRGGEGVLLPVPLYLILDGGRYGHGRCPAVVERGTGAARQVSVRREPERCAEDERETRRHHRDRQQGRRAAGGRALSRGRFGRRCFVNWCGLHVPRRTCRNGGARGHWHRLPAHLLHDACSQVGGRLGGRVAHGGLQGQKVVIDAPTVGAGAQMCAQCLRLLGRQLAVEQLADLLLIMHAVAHLSAPPFVCFDAYWSGRFPSASRKSQSFRRARNRRDFTVPASRCSTLPISA